jgi:hypothetical protein
MGQEEEQKNNIDREELKELQTITHHSCTHRLTNSSSDQL